MRQQQRQRRQILLEVDSGHLEAKYEDFTMAMCRRPKRKCTMLASPRHLLGTIRLPKSKLRFTVSLVIGILHNTDLTGVVTLSCPMVRAVFCPPRNSYQALNQSHNGQSYCIIQMQIMHLAQPHSEAVLETDSLAPAMLKKWKLETLYGYL